jgi:hypothetical protein
MQGLISFLAGRRRVWLPFVVVLGCLGAGAAPALASTYTVMNTDSTGAGSLAEAVSEANADPSPPTTVTFARGVSGTIYLLGGTLTISQSVAIEGPGADVVDVSGNDQQIIRIPSSSSTVSLSGLEFSAGSVQGDSDGRNYGGAIYNAGTLTVDRDVFDHNFAGGAGGASQNLGNGYGGAIYTTGPLTVAGSTFTNNTAGGTGGSGDLTGRGVGGAIDAYDSLTVTGSTFAGNGAGGAPGAGSGSGAGFGGAIGVSGGPLTLTNSTITGNTAEDTGGGLYDGSGSSSLSGDTIDANSAGVGAGILNNGSQTVQDTIVSGNTGSANCANNGTMTGHSSLEGPAGATSCGFDLPSADPLLGSLQDNGGPTRTQALAAGSPALGAVGAAAYCPATDQRGATRPRGACDVGAYESAPPVIGSESASGAGTTAENLSAAVSNPDVKDGTVWFQYGMSTAYGTNTNAAALPAGAAGSSHGAGLSGLAPGTVYHFRTVAQNADGSVYGPDQVFKTASPATGPGPGPHPSSPADAFTFGKTKVAPNGAISLAVHAPGAGRFTSKATFIVRRVVAVRVHGKRRVKHVTTTYIYGTSVAASQGNGPVQLVFRLSQAAAAQLKKLGHAQVTVAVTFTPAGGKPKRETKRVTIRRSRKGEYS